jgi:hypothetical protein
VLGQISAKSAQAARRQTAAADLGTELVRDVYRRAGGKQVVEVAEPVTAETGLRTEKQAFDAVGEFDPCRRSSTFAVMVAPDQGVLAAADEDEAGCLGAGIG